MVFREFPAGTFERIDSRLNVEGSGSGAASTVLIGATPGVAAAQVGRLAFNAFGRASEITPAAIATFNVSAPVGACGTGANDVRCLRVVVTPAGSIKMCDPQVPATALTDSRRCP